MASIRASISKHSKRPKINIIPPKQLFIDLTNDDTKTPSLNYQVSSPSAPNAPSKTPSTIGTSSSSNDHKSKSPTSSTSLSTHGYLNLSMSPPPRVPPPPPTQESGSMDITLTLSPITPLDVQINTPSPPSPLFGHPIPWNLLEAHVLSNGNLLNQADKCVYSKFDETGKGIIICLYVVDMLIFGTNQVQVDLAKEFLSSRFLMKDMEEADVILVSTLMDTSEKLMPNNGQAVSQLEYSRVIGCLMYAMTSTRPDIAFVVGKLSRYTSNPGTQHWQAIQRVLKYLKKTMDYRLAYTGYSSVLEGYTDASWIRNTKDNSSTSGWVFLLGGDAIFWASKKQTCITGSTMESEFVALAATGKELNG
ncbi:zinc finger, CCHC-type containing protein [Tanacetum coccineum]